MDGPRKQGFMLLHCLCVLLSVACWATAPARGQGRPLSDTLSNAVAHDVVDAEFASLGGGSGDTVSVAVKRTAKAGRGPIVLSVRPGLRLSNSNATEQNMVVARVRGRIQDDAMLIPASTVRVPPSGSATYLLEAYCTEFRKANPDRERRLYLSKPEAVLACILDDAHRHNLSVIATQAAVWIYTDHISFQEAKQKLSLRVEDWNVGVTAVRRCLH